MALPRDRQLDCLFAAKSESLSGDSQVCNEHVYYFVCGEVSARNKLVALSGIDEKARKFFFQKFDKN